jgi:activating signal cointegrator 1
MSIEAIESPRTDQSADPSIDRLKVLSVIQPWATLLVIGAKEFETRSWTAYHRGPLVIHASQARTHARGLFNEEPFRSVLTKAGYPTADSLPFGCLVGGANLVNVVPTTEILRNRLASEQELAFGDFDDGRFAWRFAYPVEFGEFRTAKGDLGFWKMTDEVEAWVRQQWNARGGNL